MLVLTRKPTESVVIGGSSGIGPAAQGDRPRRSSRTRAARVRGGCRHRRAPTGGVGADCTAAEGTDRKPARTTRPCNAAVSIPGGEVVLARLAFSPMCMT